VGTGASHGWPRTWVQVHGLAEYIAQEEMDRRNGFWWSNEQLPHRVHGSESKAGGSFLPGIFSTSVTGADTNSWLSHLCLRGGPLFCGSLVTRRSSGIHSIAMPLCAPFYYHFSSFIPSLQVDSRAVPLFKIVHQGKSVVGAAAEEDHAYPFAGVCVAQILHNTVSAWVDEGFRLALPSKEKGGKKKKKSRRPGGFLSLEHVRDADCEKPACVWLSHSHMWAAGCPVPLSCAGETNVSVRLGVVPCFWRQRAVDGCGVGRGGSPEAEEEEYLARGSCGCQTTPWPCRYEHSPQLSLYAGHHTCCTPCLALQAQGRQRMGRADPTLL